MAPRADLYSCPHHHQFVHAGRLMHLRRRIDYRRGVHPALAGLAAPQLLGRQRKSQPRILRHQQHFAPCSRNLRVIAGNIQRNPGIGRHNHRRRPALQRRFQKACMFHEDQALRSGAGKARNPAYLNVAALAEQRQSAPPIQSFSCVPLYHSCHSLSSVSSRASFPCI